MSVYRRYSGKKILEGDPNWEKGTWYVLARISGQMLHKAIRGVRTKEEAQAVEADLLRKIAGKVESGIAAKIAKRLNGGRATASTEYIYILASGGFFKIGRTNSINQRLKALADTIIPFDTHLVCALQVEGSSAVEADLHTMFAHCRVRGEWFALQPREIDRLLLYLIGKSVYI